MSDQNPKRKSTSIFDGPVVDQYANTTEVVDDDVGNQVPTHWPRISPWRCAPPVVLEPPIDPDTLRARLDAERGAPKPRGEKGFDSPHRAGGFWWMARRDGERAVWLGGGWHKWRYLRPEVQALLVGPQPRAIDAGVASALERLD